MAHAKKEVIGVNFVKDTSQPERRETRGASVTIVLKRSSKTKVVKKTKVTDVAKRKRNANLHP